MQVLRVLDAESTALQMAKCHILVSGAPSHGCANPLGADLSIDAANILSLYVFPYPRLHLGDGLKVLMHTDLVDSSRSAFDSSQTKGPSLWMAVFDETLSLQQALEGGHSSLTLTAANADNFIILAPVLRRPLSGNSVYEYSKVSHQ